MKLEHILDRQEHWEKAADAARRALDVAERQIANCQRLRLMFQEEVQVVLLHGGEE